MGSPVVLIIDPDGDLAEMACEVLMDDGYSVSVVSNTEANGIRREVGRTEPDCILVDGGDDPHWPDWTVAEWLQSRERAIPVIVVLPPSHAPIADSDVARKRHTRVADILEKPFDADVLLEAVARAAWRTWPFDGSAHADEARSAALKSRLEEAGAVDVRCSQRRECATFRTRSGDIFQVYWSVEAGAYRLLHLDHRRGTLVPLGEFYELGSVIALALPGERRRIPRPRQPES